MKLIVRNFGPIRDVEINDNKLVIFIGPQASGKSVLAKLLAIFSDYNFLANLDLEEQLGNYNIEFLEADTYFFYKTKNYTFRYKNSEPESILHFLPEGIHTASSSEEKRDTKKEVIEKKLDSLLEELVESNLKLLELDFPIEDQEKEKLKSDALKATNLQLLKELIKRPNSFNNSIYIPTERIFTASISDSLFNFIKNDVEFAKCVVDFGAKYEKVRKELMNYHVPGFDDLVFSHRKMGSFLRIGKDKEIRFSQSSSGLLAVIPLLMVVDFFTEETQSRNFFVEEPELNLYPAAQKKVIEHIVSKTLPNHHKLIVTTHSPYVITSLANLIEARNTAKVNSDAINEVKEIIPEYFWIDFNEVSAYYIDNGTAKDILDHENRTIDANAIDDVSDEIAQEFDALLDIKYRE